MKRKRTERCFTANRKKIEKNHQPQPTKNTKTVNQFIKLHKHGSENLKSFLEGRLIEKKRTRVLRIIFSKGQTLVYRKKFVPKK